jgi:type IV fimbrial biogenesis protein FimT
MHMRQPADVRLLPGYTLIELMLGLALLGILLTWGVPNFVDLYQRNLIATQTQRLMGDLFHARSEAIKRNKPVVICRSQDASHCTPSSTSQADWSMGWITFVNEDEDKNRDPDEPVLRRGGTVPGPLSVQFNHWWRMTFRPNGGAGNGTFTLCDQAGNEYRITVYHSGRTRVSKSKADSSTCPAP